MSRMLWRRTGIEPEEWSCLSEGPAQARPSGATALLACGHGMTLEGNPSRTGVWIATQGDRRRTPKLLSSQDLWRMPAVRRMLLNCCVLGRTSEAMGEPLGLVAQAFGRGAHFVLGALVRLGDLEAALFGLAYQFRLAAAYAAGTGAVDWVDEFLELQGGLRARRWPDGFASWLGTHLPLALQAVVPDVDAARADDDAFEARQSWCRLFDRVLRNCGASLSPPRVSEHWHDFYPLLAGVLAQEPPKSLRRVAPWMVVLGR